MSLPQDNVLRDVVQCEKASNAYQAIELHSKELTLCRFEGTDWFKVIMMVCTICSQKLVHVGRFWVCPEHGPITPHGLVQVTSLDSNCDSHEKLSDLAQNLWWAWQPELDDIFSQIAHDRWDSLGQNPLRLLGGCSPQELETCVQRLGLSPWITWAHRRQKEYLGALETWGSVRAGVLGHRPVAFFSAEYGLHQSLPVFSGGLGVLAGDYLKSASDLGVSIVGVGLLYREGYLTQHVDCFGWQEEDYVNICLNELPIRPALDRDQNPVLVSVETRQGPIYAKVWVVSVGRISLYLLDTEVPMNRDEDRSLTSRVYGGDERTRIRQELVLGVGGMRALQSIGLQPSVIHMFESFSAFAPLEMCRQLMMTEGLSFGDAMRETASMGVLTTHTPVPAGHDRFGMSLVEEHLGPLRDQLGLSVEQFRQLGCIDAFNAHEPFCMTVLGFKLSRWANALSSLHGVVCRRMWASLWPNRTEDEVPIGHVMTGVHVPTWLAEPMRCLYDRYLPANWISQTGHPDVWAGLEAVSHPELWAVRNTLKQKLITFCRKRSLDEARRRGEAEHVCSVLANALSPDVLLIGWARRIASYKRLDLILYDMELLERLVKSFDRPIQIVFAGKSHPKDQVGKRYLQQIFGLTRQEPFVGKFIFLEDYDISLARQLVHGVDLWLSTPRRPLEASGTSGQKVLLNGGLNCSILDGWWAEAYDGSNGYAIGNGRMHVSDQVQDSRDAEALYEVLDREVLPDYYDRDKDGIPQRWIRRMKRSIRTLGWRYNTDRMLVDYVRRFYITAAGGTWLDLESYISSSDRPEIIDGREPRSQKLVFVSSKSADYSHASKVFEFLNANGVPTFFSQESLPTLSNADYRKEIDRALDDAKHMLVVTSSYGNVTSPWVEAEWGMFIGEKRAGRKSGNLITLLIDMDSRDLPFSLRGFEALPFSQESLERILGYVK